MEIVREEKSLPRISSLRSLKVQRSRDSSSGRAVSTEMSSGFTPPLTIEKGRFDQAIQVMDRAFGKIEASHTI